jgi:hypothetical protein
LVTCLRESCSRVGCLTRLSARITNQA